MRDKRTPKDVCGEATERVVTEWFLACEHESSMKLVWIIST